MSMAKKATIALKISALFYHDKTSSRVQQLLDEMEIIFNTAWKLDLVDVG